MQQYLPSASQLHSHSGQSDTVNKCRMVKIQHIILKSCQWVKVSFIVCFTQTIYDTLYCLFYSGTSLKRMNFLHQRHMANADDSITIQ